MTQQMITQMITQIVTFDHLQILCCIVVPAPCPHDQPMSSAALR